MRTFDLDDLHIFRSVVREGGVNKAAAKLHRVPSNVSTRVKQLEDRLGVQLFQKRGRGIELTPAGRTLLGHAEKILQLADTTEQDLRSGVVRGVFRLGSLESAAAARLPAILSRFHAHYPDVSIELKTGTTATMLRLLETYEVEAAFVSETFEKGALSSMPAFEEELVLITARTALAPKTASDLNETTIIAFPHGCSYRRHLVEWLAEAGASPSRFIEVGSYHAIIACVAAGTGVAIVPAEILNVGTLDEDVKRHAISPKRRKNCTHLIWQGKPSEALQALIGFLP